MMTVTIGQVY